MTTQIGAAPTKRIALLASSGANLRSQGGSDPQKMVADIAKQIHAAGFELGAVQYVSATSSFDSVAQGAQAELWALNGQGRLEVVAKGDLAAVNEQARIQDSSIAQAIADGEFDGVILMSADPKGVNALAVGAAIAAQLPASGTGGTSIADAQQLGLNLVAVSGTIGSTSTTRAVSYVAGLARYWKVKYRPALGTPTQSAGPLPELEAGDTNPWRRISIRGTMMGALPAFIALAMILALSKVPFLSDLTPVFDLLITGLPVVVAAVAARKISGLDEVGLTAGVLAGVLSVNGGVLGGLVGGILAGVLSSYLIGWTLKNRFPVTTANIVTGAIAGLVSGLLVFFVLAPITTEIADSLKVGIEWALDFNPILAGALAGLIMWPAIIGGVYHAAILPLVLLEMSEKGHSFFGAVDMVALVMVAFGITLANVVRPRTSGERALAGSGAAVTFFFGTFVEAAYPFMFGDKRVFGVAIGAATIGGAVAGAFKTEATAYLPAFVAPTVASSPVGLICAMVVSAGFAFVGTYLINLAVTRAHAAKTGEPVPEPRAS